MLRLVDMHPGQLSISPEMVRELVDVQFPQWKQLPVKAVLPAGTVNAIFRIGDHFVGRFPLERDEPDAVRQRLLAEADAANQLLGVTRFGTPRPVAIGDPGFGYPLAWAVYTWLPGQLAFDEDPSRSDEFATDLAEFITGIHAIDTRGRTYDGNGRGGDLYSHDEWMQECLTNSEGLLDVVPLRGIWSALRDLPRGDTPDVMNHGDLLPTNLLVASARLTAVLDVGGLGAADPALDLMSAWHLLDTERREILRTALGCDDAEWQRGKAWAFEQAMGAVWYYVESNPAFSAMARRTLQRIVADNHS